MSGDRQEKCGELEKGYFEISLMKTKKCVCVF